MRPGQKTVDEETSSIAVSHQTGSKPSHVRETGLKHPTPDPPVTPVQHPLIGDTSSFVKPIVRPVAGVLDEPYSQLIPLSEVAVQTRQST